MKKCILSALAGALTMFILLMLIANTQQKGKPEEYNHVDYVSTITQEECFVCSEKNKLHWGEDNVGIVNMNNFDLLYLEINRYGDHGELIEEPAGVMFSGSLMDLEAESYAHAYVFPDNAYASIQITGVQYSIDRDSVQSNLCQTCLDSINSLWFTDQPPAEYAIVSYEDHTIQPLLNAHPWFSAGNYGVDCEFKENKAIDLLIHYCPNRFSTTE